MIEGLARWLSSTIVDVFAAAIAAAAAIRDDHGVRRSPSAATSNTLAPAFVFRMPCWSPLLPTSATFAAGPSLPRIVGSVYLALPFAVSQPRPHAFAILSNRVANLV